MHLVYENCTLTKPLGKCVYVCVQTWEALTENLYWCVSLCVSYLLVTFFQSVSLTRKEKQQYIQQVDEKQ